MRREPDVRQELVERAGTLMRDFAAMDEVRSFARFGVIDRSIGEPPCARRCRRTDARNATVDPDDQAMSSTAVEANRPVKAVLAAQTA
jgi:hypothetical protein